MTDNSNSPKASNSTGASKSTANGIYQMICLNLIPVIVGYLDKQFPALSESTWFEITAFALSMFGTFLVWISWKNFVAWMVEVIKSARDGFNQIRQAFNGKQAALIFFTLFATSLSGCSTLESLLQPNPNVVATLESSLAAADSAAMVYIQLPRCGSAAAGGSKVCSAPNIVRSIASAAQNAFIAVKAAEANETASTVQSAQNLIDALQAVVPSSSN